MKTQRDFSLVLGIVSLTIGILKFLSVANIPAMDASVHIVTGIIFIAGAIIKNGKYCGRINLILGIVYIIFGAVEFNLAHIIAGTLAIIVSFAGKKNKK